MRFWAIICIVMMGVSIMLELLTPSMGAFTLVALGCAIASVVFGFRESPSFGYVMIGANLILGPLFIWLGFHFMRKSPLMHEEVLESGSASAADAPALAHLIGQEGKTLSPLRPGGSALIGSLKIDVVTQGKFVEPNTAVKVIHIEGNRVVVEPVG